MDLRLFKQIFILVIFLIIIGGVVFLIIRPYIFKKQIDQEKVFSPQIIETGYFNSGEGIINAYAKIRNLNPDWTFTKINYEFLFYGGDDELVKLVKGESFLLAQQVKFIVEPAIMIAYPSLRVKFNIIEPIKFEKVAPNPSLVQILNKEIIPEQNQVVITGEIRNNSFKALSKIEIIGVGFRGDKVEVVSRTIVFDLAPEGQQTFRLLFPKSDPGLSFETDAYGIE